MLLIIMLLILIYCHSKRIMHHSAIFWLSTPIISTGKTDCCSMTVLPVTS